MDGKWIYAFIKMYLMVIVFISMASVHVLYCVDLYYITTFSKFSTSDHRPVQGSIRHMAGILAGVDSSLPQSQHRHTLTYELVKGEKCMVNFQKVFMKILTWELCGNIMHYQVTVILEIL